MVASTLTRRSFLRARLSTPEVPRPPGSGGEALFTQRCTRCGECVDVCPEAIIQRDASGYPLLDLARGGCTFCQACTDVCPSQALQAGTPWPWQVAVSPCCLALNRVYCRSCSDVCDAHAIRFRVLSEGLSEPHIDTTACTGCGFCIGSCPGSALQLVPCAAEDANAIRRAVQSEDHSSDGEFAC